MKKNRYIYIIIGILVLIAIVGTVALGQAPARTLATYFEYSAEEVASLSSLQSDKTISMADLYRWEEDIFELVSENKIGTASASKIYAYLLVAQRDAAYLSFNTHQEFQGSLDPVSKEVICIFISEGCQTLAVETDAYSEQLAEIVLQKVRARIAEDEQLNRVYPIKEGDHYWAGTGTSTYNGQDVGSWKTWLIETSDQFRLPEPAEFGSSEDLRQVEAVVNTLENLTNEQEIVIVRWSGGPGTKTAAAQWLDLVSTYMRENEINDLEQALLIRSVLEMTIADAIIAAHDSKYTYWVQRPFARDDSIRTIMPTPNHPSYPSSSATIAMAGATVVSHYFPEEAATWMAVAEEIGNSRVWSGIHFPVDVEQGALQGEKIAKEAVDRSGQ